MRAGTRMFILVHGDNLLSPYLTTKYRLSPEPVEAVGPVELLSPVLISEWRVSYLMKPKARMLLPSCSWCLRLPL